MTRIGRIYTDFKSIEEMFVDIRPIVRYYLRRSIDMLHKELTSQIINAFYTVYNTLGYGFLEKVYENSLIHELETRGLRVDQQVPVNVYYDGLLVGEYFTDILVEECVILELKAVDEITDQHKAQLLNYLKATKMEVGLLLNFGPEPKFARKILTNDRKPFGGEHHLDASY